MSVVLSRRAFLTSSLALGGTVALAIACDAAPARPDVATPSFHFGGNMSPKILVGYATRTGSTVAVAEAIAAVLADRGASVDVKPLRDHPQVDGYDASLIGSAVNGGAWLPEAVGFVADNAEALARIPLTVFCVHIMNLGDDEKSRRRRLAYLAPVRALVTPQDEAFFAGVGLNPMETSFIARWAFWAFGGGEGDQRDWETIRGWARAVRV